MSHLGTKLTFLVLLILEHIPLCPWEVNKQATKSIQSEKKDLKIGGNVRSVSVHDITSTYL